MASPAVEGNLEGGPSHTSRHGSANNEPTLIEDDSDSSYNGQPNANKSRKRRLRRGTRRVRPGQYREEEVYDLPRASYIHPDPVFNPVLASFTGGPSLPLDYAGPSPSRIKYATWLAERGLTEAEHVAMIRQGKGLTRWSIPPLRRRVVKPATTAVQVAQDHRHDRCGEGRRHVVDGQARRRDEAEYRIVQQVEDMQEAVSREETAIQQQAAFQEYEASDKNVQSLAVANIEPIRVVHPHSLDEILLQVSTCISSCSEYTLRPPSVSCQSNRRPAGKELASCQRRVGG